MQICQGAAALQETLNCIIWRYKHSKLSLQLSDAVMSTPKWVCVSLQWGFIWANILWKTGVHFQEIGMRWHFTALASTCIMEVFTAVLYFETCKVLRHLLAADPTTITPPPMCFSIEEPNWQKLSLWSRGNLYFMNAFSFSWGVMFSFKNVTTGFSCA